MIDRDDSRIVCKRHNEAECLFRGLKGYRRIFSGFETLDAMYRRSLNADMIKASRTRHKKFHLSGNIQPLEGC